MLKKLKLSKSGYYEYLKRKTCRQKIRKARITERIKEIHKDSKEIYGAPKITRILKKEGEKISEKYVGNIMRLISSVNNLNHIKRINNFIKIHYKEYTLWNQKKNIKHVYK